MSTPILRSVRSRSVRSRAAVVLAAFVAAVLVALLAPLAHPVAYELVCSANGSHVVALDAAGSRHADPTDHAADPGAHCPLCMPAGAPPGFIAWDSAPVQPLSHVLQSIPAARLAGLVGAPLPARGPPPAS